MRAIVIFAGAATCVLAAAQVADAQTRDQLAYNAVFDKLATFMPSTPSESVHVLRIIVPASWADEDDDDAALELQEIAGSIPDEFFALDPSRMKRKLHQVYADYVGNVVLPATDEKNEKPLQDASDEYTAAQKEYERVLKEDYKPLWDARVSELKARGKPVTTQERLRFRAQHAGLFASVQNRMDVAMKHIQKYSDVNVHYLRALRNLKAELDGAQSSDFGIFSYTGGNATLRTISADCPDDGAGWDEFKLNQTVNSQTLRSSNWNANGGWDGGFFAVNGGGGGTNFDNLIKTSNDYALMRFCSVRYIKLSPGNWFDMSFLQAIERGDLKLKSGAPDAGKAILGKRGAIPYLVKGAIVARRVVFKVGSDASTLHDVQQSSSGSGGFRIGPWSIGGGGGSSTFTHEYTQDAGSYGRSTVSTVPVILAIVTEATTGNGDKEPDADKK